MEGIKKMEEDEEIEKIEEIFRELDLIEKEYTSKNNSNPEENEKLERKLDSSSEELKFSLRPISGEAKSALDKIKLIKEDTSTKSDKIKSIISELLKYYEKEGKVDDIPSAISDIMYHCETRALEVFSCTISRIASKSIGGDWVERVVSMTVEAFDVMSRAEEKVIANCLEILRFSKKDNSEILKFLREIIESRPDLIYKIIKGLVLTCKLSEFSNLFLEIIKVNPAPENVKLCMEAVAESALKHDLNSDYIINPLKKIIEYCEGKGDKFVDSIISNFTEVFKSVFSQYLSKGISEEEICELLSSLIDLKIKAPDLNSKYINSIIIGLSFVANDEKYDIDSLLLGLFINKPECLEKIAVAHIDYKYLEQLKMLLNIVIGGISNELLLSFMIRITKILESRVSNDEKYKIFANLIEDNPDRAIYVMQGVTSCCHKKGKNWIEIYDYVLKVFEQQREEENRKLTVGGAVAYMISNGKTDEIYNFLLHAARETKDTEKLADITLGVGLGLRESRTFLIDETRELLSKLNNNEELKKIPNIEDFILMNIIRIANNVLRNTLSKDNIEKLTSIIDEIYSKVPDNKEKILNAKRLVLHLVLNEYFYMWLINKTGVSEETEKAILDLFNKVFERKYDRLSQIKFSEFGSLSYPYCKTKFRTFGVSRGYQREVFSKIILDRKTADNDKIGDKIKPEDFENVSFAGIEKIFKDHKGTITNEELFKRIGLKKSDFGGKNSFKIFIDISFGHAYIVVINTSISWGDAISGKVDCIAIIDSSNSIKWMCDEKKIMPDNFIELFSNIKTINDPFQENGTCYLYPILVVSVINKCTTFKDILGGFGYQIKNGKIVKKENSEFKPLQYEIIGKALLSYSPSLPKECKEAEESATDASSTSSDNTSDEEYRELSIKTSGEDVYTKIKQSNYFVEISKTIETLEQLCKMTSEYKDKESRLSEEGNRLVEIGEGMKKYKDKESGLSEEGGEIVGIAKKKKKCESGEAISSEEGGEIVETGEKMEECESGKTIPSKVEILIKNEKGEKVGGYTIYRRSDGIINCERTCFKIFNSPSTSTAGGFLYP